MGTKGKSGCGCLIFILVICLICIGALMHPFSLKLLAKQMRYADTVSTADIIFVHRFAEDKNGELYTEAFREYWAGNGKMVYIEDDKILGMSLGEIIDRMAKTKGVKENIVKAIEVEGSGKEKVKKIKEKIQALGYRKVLVLVPEYASKRYHLFYGPSEKDGKVLYMIKPVEISYYKSDKWWKEPVSRSLLLKEYSERVSLWLSRIRGAK